jgi:hypothetical protein
MRKIVIFMLALAAITGCSSKIRRISEKIPPTDQIVLFSYSNINHAWGYQNRGWFIDNHGLAKAYRVTDKNLWHEAEKSGPDSGYISQSDLLADYVLADKVVFEYSHFIITGKIGLIPKAAAGENSTLEHSAYDAGLGKYSAYYFDKAKGEYKEVVLSISGDWTQTNLSPAADTLNEWLQSFQLIYEDSLRAWDEAQGGGK